MSNPQVTWWNFSITNLPSPPTGINQGSLPPAAQSLASTTVQRIDTQNIAFMIWYTPLMVYASVPGSDASLKAAVAAFNAGNLDINQAPWPDAIKAMAALAPELPAPPAKAVQLTAWANWVQIFEIYNSGDPATHELTVQTGVTSSEEQTKAFGAEVGLSVEGGFGPISATVSASFSASLSRTVAISLSKETTQSTQFSLPAKSFVQIWQLQMSVVADNAAALTQTVESYQSLSFTASS